MRRGALTVAAVVFVLTAKAVSVVGDVPGELNRAGVLNRAGAMSERIDDLSRRLRKTMPQGSHVPSRNSEALLPFYAYVERCTSIRDRLVMTGLRRTCSSWRIVACWRTDGLSVRPFTPREGRRKTIARMQSQSVPLVIISLEEEADFGRSPLVAAYLDTH